MWHPLTKSIAFRIKARPIVMQPTMKKNKLCSWNPYRGLELTLSLIAPIIRGKTPRAKFWSISMSPKAVPNNLWLIIMGSVGTKIEQNIPVPIPRKQTGTHLINSEDLNSTLVSVIIIDT
jgi:hypothetical protein